MLASYGEGNAYRTYRFSDLSVINTNWPKYEQVETWQERAKRWAMLLREFLEEILGQWRTWAAIKERDSDGPPKRNPTIRSGTQRQREWKMKLWVQTL